MMLDSSLGKILKNKPVEPSVPIDDRLSPTKEDHGATSSRSEAEVRLVVRFFVEEHIVFNGKIERVRQLESEELSRIVSRIAWDNPKDCGNPPLDVDPVLSGDKNDTSSTQDPDSSLKMSAKLSTTPDSPIREIVDFEPKHIQEAVLDDVIETNSSLGSHVSPREDTTIAQYDIEFEGSNVNPLIADCDTHQAEQVTLDNNKEHCLDKLEMITLDAQQSVEIDANLIASSTNIHDTVELKDEASETDQIVRDSPTIVENQTIVDTLNDCVRVVEMQLNQISENISLEVSTKKIGQVSEKVLLQVKLNNMTPESDAGSINESHNIILSRNNDKTDKRPLMEAANVPPETNLHKSCDSQQESCFPDMKARSDQPMRNGNLHLNVVSVKIPDNQSPKRRRNTIAKGPPNKRKRCAIAKDEKLGVSSEPRDHILRNRPRPQAQTRLISSALKDLMTASMSDSNPNDYLANHSKIFAKWTDNHFYPGTILKPSRDRKFTIGFFDGAHRNVAETDLIPLCNILGHQVRVSLAGDYCVNAIVHGEVSSHTDSSIMFDVEYQQDALVRRKVPMKDIFLTAEQGASLINQMIRPDKNPDESMFAGVDLDNIVHVKRSRRLQELEELEIIDNPSTVQQGTKRRRARHTNNKSKINSINSDTSLNQASAKSLTDVNLDTPVSSCSPESNSKANMNGLISNPPSESNSSTSTGSSNSANVLEMGQEFYFDSSSPHRTKTSLLL